MNAQAAAFRVAASLLNDAGITWWLSDGAVLGALRGGAFLPTDPDVDLGVRADDMPAVRAAFAAHRIRRDRASQLWPVIDGVKIDVHGHELDLTAGEVFYRLGRREQYRYAFPAHLFGVLDTVDFYGVTAKIPTPAEEYLTVHYGPDWATPRPVWRWDADPPCLRISP